MTVLYSVNDNDPVDADDVNQYKSMLEGASGYTSTYKLQATANTDFVIKLGDAAAGYKLSIQDSAGNEVGYIDSDGNLNIDGGFTPGTLTLPVSASPAPTTEGQIMWDSDDDKLVVGNGSGTTVIGPTYKYKSADQTISASTTFVDVTATSGNFAFTIGASEVWQASAMLYVTTTSTGGFKLQFTGPSAPSTVRVTARHDYVIDTTASLHVVGHQDAAAAFSSSFAAHNASAATTASTYNTSLITAVEVTLFVINGANAGTVTLQAAQNSAAGTAVIEDGSWFRAERVA